MRITANVPEDLGRNAKIFASNENISVSNLVTKALEFYMTQCRKKEMGEKLLSLSGKGHVSAEVYKEIDSGRSDDRV